MKCVYMERLVSENLVFDIVKKTTVFFICFFSKKYKQPFFSDGEMCL